jgi:hypothetical protein
MKISVIMKCGNEKSWHRSAAQQQHQNANSVAPKWRRRHGESGLAIVKAQSKAKSSAAKKWHQ